MREVTLPIGPGKGQVRPVMEALQMMFMDMRGYAADLYDSGEEARSELLECYAAALELIWWQGSDQVTFGVGMPIKLVKLAKKYHLALPAEYQKR